jgi:hypothetical protein
MVKGNKFKPLSSEICPVGNEPRSTSNASSEKLSSVALSGNLVGHKKQRPLKLSRQSPESKVVPATESSDVKQPVQSGKPKKQKQSGALRKQLAKAKRNAAKKTDSSVQSPQGRLIALNGKSKSAVKSTAARLKRRKHAAALLAAASSAAANARPLPRGVPMADTDTAEVVTSQTAAATSQTDAAPTTAGVTSKAIAEELPKSHATESGVILLNRQQLP